MNLARSVCFILLFLVGGATANADANSYGFELDALPYLTGGYYLSGLIGVDNYRIRAVSASTTVPEFATKRGFMENNIDAFALILDYFPYEKHKGLWYGVGVEYWKQRIRDAAGTGEGRFQNTVATAGVGYIWYFHRHFYLNPWAAVHAVASGTDGVRVGSTTYNPPQILPEASLKFGVAF